MRALCPSILLLAILAIPLTLIAQDQQEGPLTGFPPPTRMETRQGYPGQADVVSHRHTLKGSHAKCILVEDHPGQADENAACLLRYDTGDKHRLNFNDSIRFAKDGEIYLECLGNKPTRCVVGLW